MGRFIPGSSCRKALQSQAPSRQRSSQIPIQRHSPAKFSSLHAQSWCTTVAIKNMGFSNLREIMVLCINGLLTLVFWIPSFLSFFNYSYFRTLLCDIRPVKPQPQPQHITFPTDLLAQIRRQTRSTDDSESPRHSHAMSTNFNLPDADGGSSQISTMPSSKGHSNNRACMFDDPWYSSSLH